MKGDAELIQVIRTCLTLRGAGKDLSDPVRRVTQFWSTDGELLAERDDWAEEQKYKKKSK